MSIIFAVILHVLTQVCKAVAIFAMVVSLFKMIWKDRFSLI